MVFTGVIHDAGYKRKYDVRRINLQALVGETGMLMSTLITQFATFRKLPLNSSFILNLLEAIDGYAVILTALVGHAVENSAAHYCQCEEIEMERTPWFSQP